MNHGPGSSGAGAAEAKQPRVTKTMETRERCMDHLRCEIVLKVIAGLVGQCQWDSCLCELGQNHSPPDFVPRSERTWRRNPAGSMIVSWGCALRNSASCIRDS